jgi:3'-phosphoadenosine 5'-phosphosulfate sulfotransferase (PAPS reductase)/FAD synthetase
MTEDYEGRKEIEERLAGHERIALAFSGGKDSTCVVELLREFLPRVTIYHLNTGDLLPEISESVERVRHSAPSFVTIERDISAWLKVYGLPTDLLPYTAHPVGVEMGEPRKTRLIGRYDCCFANLMWPLYERVKADGNTMLIRGTKFIDIKRMPAADGDVLDGVELYYPIQDWNNQQVRSYLAKRGIPLPRLYQYMTNSPECARCSAWWNEGRAEYLKEFYPQIFADYDARLQLVINEIATPLAQLRREAGVA